MPTSTFELIRKGDVQHLRKDKCQTCPKIIDFLWSYCKTDQIVNILLVYWSAHIRPPLRRPHAHSRYVRCLRHRVRIASVGDRVVGEFVGDVILTFPHIRNVIVTVIPTNPASAATIPRTPNNSLALRKMSGSAMKPASAAAVAEQQLGLA